MKVPLFSHSSPIENSPVAAALPDLDEAVLLNDIETAYQFDFPENVLAWELIPISKKAFQPIGGSAAKCRRPRRPKRCRSL